MVLKIYCQQKTVMSYSDGFWKITIKKMNVGEFVAVVGTSGSKRWVNAGSTIPYEAGIISIMQAGPFPILKTTWKAGESEIICLHGGLRLCLLARQPPLYRTNGEKL